MKCRVISRRQFFQHKKEPAPAVNWRQKSICLDNVKHRSLSYSDFEFFCRSSLDIWYDWQCKQTLDFSVWVKAHCGNDAECLDFVLSDPIKKCKCINHLMLILCFQHATLLKTRTQHRRLLQILQIFSVSNFIKNETLARVFSCESCKIFQPVF